MELNDSSDLESTLHGMSIRDAVSPAPDRRISSGSLMSVVSEVCWGTWTALLRQ